MKNQGQIHSLWYQTPSTEWKNGLPIGNGRLAAMVMHEEKRDRLALNHESLWRGRTRNRTTKEVSQWLPEVRRLLREGDFFRATALANVFFSNQGGISDLPHQVDAYQPAGDLIFEYTPSFHLTKRSLCLNDGTAYASRSSEQGEILSRTAVDCNDGCLLYEINGTAPFDGTVFLYRIPDSDADISIKASGTNLTLDGSFHNGIAYCVRATVTTDGICRTENEKIIISQATNICVCLDIALEEQIPCTDYDFDKCFAAHQEKFRSYMDRFSFCLDAEVPELPTDERLQRLRDGGDDISLNELFVHYGRYLLLSSSICGKLPANLQGKWNEELNPPWESDYHFDINLEMCYWLAEPCGMPECVDALISLVEHFYESGEKAARDLYGCRGIWLPLQSDAWGCATPESYGWAVWIGAAAWIGWHFWQHFLYSGDMDFLREHGFPYFKRVAEFYEDYTEEDENGVLQIYPSQSPENRFAGTGHFPVSIGISSAMDVQLAYDSFTYALKSARLLGKNEMAEHWENMRDRLPSFAIGSDGRLLEWEKEREEIEPGHRHLSHLYGLYPSGIFTREEFAPQKEAAIRSLYSRLSHGGGHTGWSRAWVSCLMARIGDREGFYEHFNALLTDFATESLLDLHPPKIFQIDGNLGAVAAAVEAVVSVGEESIRLLAGLPKEWASGSMDGVCLPGGHKLSLSWKDGQLCRLIVTFGFAESLTIEGFGTLSGICGETRIIL